VYYAKGRTKLQAHGELLAVHADSLFVLSANSLTAIPTAKTKKATLTVYDANVGPLVAWSVLGTLSTASHGAGLIISAPVWIIAGIAATSAQSHAPRITFPRKSWKEFRMYARFPTGLPPGLDRRSLRPVKRTRIIRLCIFTSGYWIISDPLMICQNRNHRAADGLRLFEDKTK
jgi:hypothetical protein